MYMKRIGNVKLILYSTKIAENSLEMHAYICFLAKTDNKLHQLNVKLNWRLLLIAERNKIFANLLFCSPKGNFDH